MNYRFAPDAKIDLFAAADFYESQRSGLGIEFAVDIGVAISRVLEAPDRWPEIEPGIRRYRLDRFPYALIYHPRPPHSLDIIAVLDLRRDLGDWPS
jgi:hypothetical protein